jgi:poly(A) polymerase Pap1
MQPVAWSTISDGRCAILPNGVVVIRKGMVAINVETNQPEPVFVNTMVYQPASVKFFDSNIFLCFKHLASIAMTAYGGKVSQDANRIFDLCNDRLPPTRRGD